MTLYEQKRKTPSSFRALTGLSIAQFDAIVPLWMEQWDITMEYQTVTGKYRWNRRHSSYKNSRLPTSADKLFFILVFIKQAPTQELHGTVFGMAQPTAHTWIHVLLPVLFATFSANGYLPARTPDELKTYRESLAHQDDTTPESLFFVMMPSSVPLSDPLIQMNSVCCTVVSGNAIPLKTQP